MAKWGFLLSKRWIGYFALMIVFAIVCTILAQWQFTRRAEAREQIALIEANYDSLPVSIGEVLPRSDSYDDDTMKWTPVLVTGEYLHTEQLLVRNRPSGGVAGFEVLTPLHTDDGQIFVVDRGWLPLGSDGGIPDEIPEAPFGRVTVTARLTMSEPELPGRSAPEGQIATIHVPKILADVQLLGYSTAYGKLIAEDPPASSNVAVPSAKPELDEGPHLSYALQWYVFALFGFGAYGYGARQEFRHIYADDPEEQEREAKRHQKKSRKARTDSEIEDAILDNSASENSRL